jgi:phosphoribosylanthranilate isomerase
MDTAQTVTPPLTALRCWVQGRRIYLEINARRSVSFPASKYKILEIASQSELEKIQLHGGGRTVSWESLDEEISVDDVAHNRFFHTAKPVAV